MSTMKSEDKERMKVPVLGFAAVLVSIVAFIFLLYIITVAIRLLFAIG